MGYLNSDEDFITAVKENKTIRQAILALGRIPRGANYSIFINRCNKLGIKPPVDDPVLDKQIANYRNIKDILDEEWEIAIKKSFSKEEICRNLSIRCYSTSRRMINKKIKSLNLDISHFKGRLVNKGSSFEVFKTPLECILVKSDINITSTTRLKKRLIQENILKEICEKCGLSNVWKDKFLSLHLEHKNGDRADNRIENLCLLCPNCHSQTPTYCRRKSSLKENG